MLDRGDDDRVGAVAWTAGDPGRGTDDRLLPSRRFQRRDDRHARLVRMAKILLPAAIVLVIAVVSVWPQFSAREPGFMLSFSHITDYDDRIRVVRPRYQGTDSHNRPFVVTADTAIQTDAEAEEITLHGLSADITLLDGTWLSITATKGVFRPQDQTLDASEGVAIHTDLGYELHSGQAFLDLQNGLANSRQPITGQGPIGRFTANGFSADLDRRAFKLDGAVKATIFPGPGH